MAQPSAIEVNGVDAPEVVENGHSIAAGKRKREDDDDGAAEDGDGLVKDAEETKPGVADAWEKKDQGALIKSYFEVLTSFDVDPPILKRPLADPTTDDEPQAKRQKSAEPPSSIADKVAANSYAHMEDVAADLLSVIKSSLSGVSSGKSEDDKDEATSQPKAHQIREFRDKAMDMFNREKAYPQTAPEHKDAAASTDEQSQTVLSVIGLAPQERRLFSSLPASENVKWSEVELPPGLSLTRVMPSDPQERTQTLGELYVSPRSLPPLQAPKQPKSQAKGNALDFYRPELSDHNKNRGMSYYSTKLSAGHYLDYSCAIPSSQHPPKGHERAQSLAGKKPSESEAESQELESLFRGAFSSFAPCKDDSAAIVPSSVAGRMWWHQVGLKSFQRMIEVDYYGEAEDESAENGGTIGAEVDEAAVKDAIENWDESVVDPTLDQIMGTKREDEEKDADEILDEVSDMIETLASYQRIRNLQLPNSQNRQSSDPVNGDMLANAGPQPTEEELATYQVLKAQLALIVKTLPPYAVSKLNGDQLEELLISTKVQVQTDQYRGVMEEDDAGMQARIRAQQQAAQAAQAQARQRAPSMSHPQGGTPNYGFQQMHQYGTPHRTPSQPQQYYRPSQSPQFQQHPRPMPPSPAQQHRPQPNQYSRPNGYPNQYATQLAKAQTPFGHQNMPQYVNQQRPQYPQVQQQGTPNIRFQYHQGFPQQQAPTPNQVNYGQHPNGSGMPRQNFPPSPHMQGQQQRYGTPNQATQSPVDRFPSPAGGQQPNPNLTGYHSSLPEAQQRRIMDQAKARAAAQERSASFTDKMGQPPGGMPGPNYGGQESRFQVQRGSLSKPSTPTPPPPRNGGTPMTFVPQRVTPVPVPVYPGSQGQRKPSNSSSG